MPAERPTAQVLEDAYIYAYPLVLLDLIREMTTNVETPEDDAAPVNQLFHTRELCTPSTTSLTRPNVDTLYSQVYFDLADEPMLLTTPATDRFLSVQTFNGYSDTPFILGSGGTDAGTAATYAFTGADFTDPLPDGVVEVPMGTDLVWLLIRIRVEDAGDLAGAHAVQDALSVRPLSSGNDWTPPIGSHDPASDFVATERITQLSTQEFFDRFNALAAHNPGTPADADFLAEIAALGIGAGQTFVLATLPADARAHAETLPTLIDQTYARAHTPMTKHNGWFFMDDRVSQFGTDYRFRAVVAHGGFANPARLTTYPALFFDKDDQFLSSDVQQSLHFEPGQLPPHLEGGWWSLTAYTLAGYLIDNEIDRYVVGTSTDLAPNPDGSVDIWLTRTDPGKQKRSNWLPTGSEHFSLVMRIYLPTEAVIDHSWSPPTLRRLDDA